MDIRSLKNTAADRLSAATYSPARLALFNTGAAVALSLLLTLINYLLTRQMGATGGLAGIGTRTLLSTVQMVLLIGGSAAIPFWDAGFMRANLCISREENAGPATLLEGFRRFGVVLRLNLIRGVFVVIVALFCLQTASMLFMMLPMSDNFVERAYELVESGAAIDEAAIAGLMELMVPVYLLWAALMLIILVPMAYRFRLADWAVMDKIPKALSAFGLSGICTRGNRMWLFRLDLSFWWYYALHLLAAVLAYGDLLLTALGITLDAQAAFFGFYVLSLVLQLLIAWRFAPMVQTTYALAYDDLLTRSGFAKTEN